MGTDYDEFRKPCPCGQGTIRVGRSSPDHGWVSAYSVHWDADIECRACRQIYIVEGTDAAMRIVRRDDVAAAVCRRRAYEAACAQLMALPSIPPISLMDKQTMRMFDEACLTPVRPLSASEIRALREREGASQAVFARYLNVTTSLVSQWERGEKHPQGASLKLLSLIDRHGLGTVA